MDLIRELADTISGQTDDLTDLRLRKASVVSVQSGTSVTVKVGASGTAIAGVTTLEPLTAGNVVWLLQQGPLLLAIGKPGGTPAPTQVSRADNLNIIDRRSTNDPPSYYRGLGRQVTVEMKQGATIGLHGSLLGETNDFVTLVTFTKWGDDSGGRTVQVAYSHADSAFGTAPQGNQSYMAMRVSNGDTAWFGWGVQVMQGQNNAANMLNVTNLNARLAAGFYDVSPGTNGSPTNDWYMVMHVRHGNVDNNNYQAQLAFHFFTGRMFYRINFGSDPTNPAHWGPWYQQGGHPEYDVGSMGRNTDYSSGTGGDVVFPFTYGTSGNDGNQNIYWDGGTRLYVRRRGLYTWHAGITYSQNYGLTSLHMRHNSGGTFASMRHNDYVYARTLSVSGTLLMEAGQWVDVVVNDPGGFHPGGFVINPFCAGVRVH